MRFPLLGATCLVIMMTTVTGCLIVTGDDDDSSPTPTSSPSGTLGTVEDDVYVTGAFNNRVAVSGDTAYVVASGDNRVEIVDLTTCSSSPGSCQSTGSAVFAQFSNPWNVHVDAANDTIYTSLLFGGSGSGSLHPANATDGTLGTEIVGGGTDFAAPQGVVVANDKVYVSNTALSCDMNGCSWGDAFVTVIDSGAVDSVIGPLPFKNPFGMHVFGGKVWVVCTGEFDENYQPASDGGLVSIDPVTDTIDGQVTIGIGAPGPNLAVVGNVAYLATSRAGELFKVNLDTQTVIYGPQNPIVLSEEPTFTSFVEVGPDGNVYAASFNEDLVYVLDPATDELVDVAPSTPAVDAYVVGPGGATPAGPVALGSWVDAEGHGYVLVLSTLANSMSRIALAD